MSLIVDWLILSVAVWASAAVLSGVRVGSFKDALVISVFVGILNFLIGWLLFAVFTVITLGIAYLLAFITRWIIDAIVLKIVASQSDRLQIDSFGWALLAALLMSAIGTLIQWIIR